jgi:3-hydroxyisobutyrate dehydrogenase
LPNSDVVDEVVGGAGGLLEILEPGSLIVDMGSSDPRRTRALAAAASRVGIGFADAPVSGGVRRARTGELTVMFGGGAELLGRCRPLLDALATHVFDLGAVGAGHTMKALNNLVSAAGLAVACEALAIGRRYGLEPEAMLDVLNNSTGSNNATETKLGQFVLSGSYASGFSLRLMLKDVSLAVDLGESEGLPAGIGRACRSLWEQAAAELPLAADQTEIARVWTDRASREQATTTLAGPPEIDPQAQVADAQRKDARA